MLILVFSKISFAIDAGADIVTCVNSTISITPQDKRPSSTIYWYKLNNSSPLSSPGGIFSIPTGTSGTFKYVVKDSLSLNASLFDTVVVTVYPRPRINAVADQVVCKNIPLSITANISPSSSIINWYLQGDTNSLSTSANFNIIDTIDGIFYYIIKADSASTCISYDTIKITVNPKPKANFTFTSNCGRNFSFSSTSSGNITNYDWNFGSSGNDNTSIISSPNHRYPKTPNTYNVRLIVTNSYGCKDTITKQVSTSTILEASLSGSNPSPEEYDGITYFKICSQNTLNYTFTFFNNSSTASQNTTSTIIWGDNSSNTVINNWATGSSGQLTHNYGIGNHFLTLIVSNGSCSDTTIYGVYLGTNPQGGISSPGNTEGCTGAVFSFPFSPQCFSNTPGTMYYIFVNDGTDTVVYTQANLPAAFTHTFDSTSCGTTSLSSPNTFAISFLISNPCRSTPGNIGGIAISRKAKASFAITPYDTICVNNSLTFTNNGITALTVGNSANCSVGKSIWSISPSTGWSINSGTGSLGNDNGYPNDAGSWTSGTTSISINFTAPGIYYIKLKTGSSLCGIDSVVKTICVNPIPTASFTLPTNIGCAPLAVTASGSTNNATCDQNTFKWSVSYVSTSGCTPTTSSYTFVDNTNNTTQNPHFNFVNPGVYTISLLTISPHGRCSSNVVTNTVTVKAKPLVSINLPTSSICQAGNITPTNTSTCYIDNQSTYAWTFTGGSPSSSTSSTPGPITYSTSGTYNISLNVTNICGTTTASSSIIVNPLPTVTTNLDLAYCNSISVPAITFGGSSVANTTYNWTNDNTSTGIGVSGTGSIPAFTAVNTSNAPIKSMIIVTPVASSCSGKSDTFYITVNPTPTVTDPADQTLCNGNSTSAISFLGNNISGVVYNWTNNTSSIGLVASGSGNISAFTAINTTNAPVISNITVTANANNCPSASQTFTITVNPTPTVIDPADQTLCNGNNTTAINFSGNNVNGVVYNWTNNTTSIGLAASGSGNIPAFNATNNGTTSVTATITVIPTYINGGVTCTGTSQTFTITVNPAPSVNFSPVNQNICSGGTSQLVTLTSTTNNVNFSWSATQPTGITGVTTTGNSTIPAQTLTNSTNASIDVTYVAKATTNGGVACPGSSFNHVITVHPKPNANATDQIICSATSTNIALSTNTTPSTAVTYTWSPSANANISGATSSSGATIAQTLSNTASTPQGITYTITPKYTSGSLTCTGDAKQVIATVNPVPNVTQPSNIIVCNNASTGNINFNSTVTNTTFSWTNNNTSIGLSAANGTGNISAFNGLNTSNTPTSTTISVTPRYLLSGTTYCTDIPKTFSITVNPVPAVNAVSDVTICHNSSTSAISFSGSVANTVYEWSNNNTSIGLGSGSTGTIPVFAAVNNGITPVFGKITVTPKYTNNAASTPVCSGTPITFTITVNPKPIVTATPATQTICSGTQVNIDLTSNISSNITYNSVPANSSNIGGASTTNLNPIQQTLTNQSTSSQSINYTITPTYTNNSVACPGNNTTATVTVNPAPTVNQPLDVTYCNNTSTSIITFSGVITGTNFSWTNNNTSIGLAASGNGDIPMFSATNSGTSPITATITVNPALSNATSCSGVSKTFTITVNPTPSATSNPSSTTICSGTAPTINLTSSITGTIGNVTYNWSPSTNSNITGASASTGTTISQTLNNISATLQSTNYSVTPTYTNNSVACMGSATTAIVNVNPIPTVNQPLSLVLCKGSSTGAISFSSSVNNTSYIWQNDNTSIGLVASGVGDINTFTVTNTTNAPLIANITVTPRYLLSGTTYCTGTPKTFSITVNPIPSVTAPNNITICKGQSTGTISITGSVIGAVYSWTNLETSIGLSASGTGDITSFNGLNTGTSPVTSTITITPSYSNSSLTCTGTNQSFSITVNPAPSVTFNPQGPQTICSNQSTATITLSSATSGVTYSWTSNSPTSINGATSIGSTSTIPAQTLINNSNQPQTVVYTVMATTSGSASCAGGSSTYNVVVNPKPVVSAQAQTICSEGTFSLTLTNSAPTTIIPTGTMYTWTVASNNNVTGQSDQTIASSTISQTLTNLTNTQQQVVYTITPTSGAAGSCVGSTFELTVSVDPKPKITDITKTICSGIGFTVSIPANNPTTVVVPLNTTYTWTYVDNPNVSGETVQTIGVSAISQTLINSTNQPQTVVYTVTPKTGNCSGVAFTVTVTVNPAPYIPNQTAITCSQIGFTITPANGVPLSTTVVPSGTTYTWTVTDNTNVSGDVNQSASQSSISQTLTNISNTNQTILYTVTPVSGAAGGCTGPDFTLTVTLSAKPVITSQQISVCSGTAFNVSPQNGVPTSSTIVPIGTTYTWTVANNTDVTGEGDQPTAQSSISQTLINTTNIDQVVVYTVTPLIGTCVGTPFTLTVTVTPAPVITNQTATICSGNPFSITPLNVPPSMIVPSGTTYTWIVASNTNVIGQSNQTNPQSSISQTLTNNTNVVQTVIYTVTPKSGTCIGVNFTITVTINPKPVVSAQAQTICSEGTFSLTLTNSAPTTIIPTGTMYTWTVASNNNVTGQSDQTIASSTISQTLTNLTNTQQQVVYTITPTSGAAGSCVGSTFELTVSVDPKPKITDITKTICSGIGFTVSIPANNPTTVVVPLNTTYTWTYVDNPNVSGETVQTIGVSAISQTLINSTNQPQTVVYTVTPKTGNCSGVAFTVTVTVNPAPYIPNQTAITCSQIGFTITPANGVPLSTTVVPSGTTYTWTVTDNTNVSGDVNQSASQSSISQTLTNISNTNQTILYTVTPVSGAAGGCTGPDFTLTVTLSAKPVITSQQISVCSGTAFNVSPQNGVPTSSTIVPIGTTYTWTVANNTDVTGEGDQPTAQSSISQTLINTTNIDQVVVYTVTPLIGTCVGTPFTLTVTVTPAPVITNQTATICSGNPFSITPLNVPPSMIVPSGTTYTWIVASNTNVIGQSNQTNPQSSISQTLTNNTNVVQTVIYTVTPKSGTCIGVNFTITVTINPKPVLADNTINLCSGVSFNFNPINNQPNVIVPLLTTYEWNVSSNLFITGQSNSSSPQTSINQTLINISNSPQVIIYTITPTSGVQGNCVGRVITYSITVNPAPVFPTMYDTTCSGSSFDTIPQNNLPLFIVPAGTTYSWNIPNMPLGLGSNANTGASGGVLGVNQNHIFGTLINTAYNPLNVTYSITPSSPNSTGNACAGSAFNFIVTVKSLPIINNIPLSQSLCNSNFSSVVIWGTNTNNIGANPTYIWGPPIHTVFNDQINNGIGNIPAMLLTNNGIRQDTIVYPVITIANGCTGPSVNDTIFVNPDAKAIYTFNRDTACWPFILNIQNTSPLTADGTFKWYADNTPIGVGYAFPGYTIPVSDKFVDIKLVTFSKYGCKNDSMTHRFYTKNYPHPSFTTTYSNPPCGPLVVQFQNLTVNFTPNPIEPFRYIWNFGNGNTSTLQNPPSQTYQINPNYTDTTYFVKLTVFNDCISKDTTVSVTVSSGPKSQFAPSETNVCSNTTISFTNSSLGNGNSYTLDFGDGSTLINTPNRVTLNHTYHVGRDTIFYAILTATNFCGVDKDTVAIHVSPSTINLNWFITASSQFGCAPHVVEIHNISYGATQFEWNFNDPNFPTLYTSGLNNELIYHTYDTPGVYNISVHASNACADTSGTKFIKVIRTPKPSFQIVNNYACPRTPVQFVNQTDVFTNVIWDFGDTSSGIQNTSIQNNPTHIYNVAGNYTVTLTATLVDISGVECTAIIRHVVNIVSPIVQIIAPSRGCVNDVIQFVPLVGSVLGLPPIKDTIWQINGVSYTTPAQYYPNFSHVFTQPGNYTITLIVGTLYGCYDTISTSIVINNKPIISVSSNQLICSGQSVQLIANSNANNYQWTPLAGLSCYNCYNPIASPVITTKYVVSTINLEGCSNKDTVLVTVVQPFKLIVKKEDTICIGQTIQLNASGASNYLWSPAQSLSCTTCPNPFATPTQNPFSTTFINEYMVVGSDNFNCFKDTAIVYVAVGQYPKVALPNDQVLSTGTLFPIIPTITNGPIRFYSWNPANDLDSAHAFSPIATIKHDICYSLEAENIYGCKGADTICIHVFCDNAQTFIPNAFTPGLLANGIFMIRAVGINKVKSFRIFNRWGQLVFERSNFPPNSPQYGWDGKVNGVIASADVFVYTAEVLCENNTTFTYKGNVTLIR